MKKLRNFLLPSFILFTVISYSQTHQWAKVINSKSNPATPFSLSSDNYGNTYMVGQFNDTLFLDTQIVTVPLYNKHDAYLAKVNSAGKLLWAKTFYISSQYDIILRHVETVSDNRIVIYGFFNTSKIKFSKFDSLTNPGGPSVNNGFVASYDSSGNFLTASRVFSGIRFLGSKFGNNAFNGELSSDSKGYCYINIYKPSNAGAIYFKGDSILLTDTVSKYIVIKYSPGFDSIIWYKEFPDAHFLKINRIRVGDDDNLYLACHAGGLNFNLGSHSFRLRNFSDKGLISILSPKGSFIYSGLVNSDSSQKDNLLDIGAVDTNNIYIIGCVRDSVLYQNTWYSSLNKSKRKILSFPYAGLVGIHSSKWIKLPISAVGITNFDLLTVGYNAERLSFDRSGHVYAAIPSGDTLLSIGGLSNNIIANLAFIKFDKMGNALWIRPFTYNINDLTCSSDSSLIYTAMYVKNVFLDPFQLKSTGPSAFLAKTNDYAIIREKVSPGPYCAGDTFSIPYYRFGKYDSSNYFIAELSDENGNFDGKERELGRRKTTQNGVINCTIPLFKLFTSTNYRIRIRSTSPPVQSFYKRDTLQLLIYSRDKANPGLPESICLGDTLKLNTYGGTKWAWSPKYNMDNPNLRQPKVWPSKDTVYQIIIGDSSGCGAPDTAYKKVLIRPALKAILDFTDTSLCSSSPLNLIVNFSGGDTIGYSFKWYYINSPKSWFPLASGAGVLRDTFVYTPTDPTEKLAIVLSDGCTKANDTAYVTFNLRTPMSIKPLFMDTVLCNGSIIRYKATAIGGVPKLYKWNWKDISHNKILSNSDTLLLVASQTSKIRLMVNDGCVELGDTNEFTIYVNPSLKGAIIYNKGSLHDTTLCFGKSLKLYSTGKGGTGSGYNYKWYLEKALLSNADTLSFSTTNLYLSTGGTKTLKLVLKDNCTSGSDSISRNIKVIPGPQSDFNWGKTCNKTKIPFAFTGSLAASPVTTKYFWQYPDGDSSNVQNPSKLLSQVGKNGVTLVLKSSNGCNDTITKDVDVKQEAIADFIANDVCEDSAVNFVNNSVDGINYEWKFGDGKTSNFESPKHLYLISGITNTFNVSLTAIVPTGCSDTIIKAVTVNANPKSDFAFTTSGKQVNFTAFETSAANFQWTFGDGGTSNTTNQKTTYNYAKFPSGKYTACLKVSNISGCISETCKEVNISGATSQPIKKNGIKIYPNPNQGSFTVEIADPKGNLIIEIYDAIGQVVHKVESFQPLTVLNLKLSEGIYLVRVTNEENNYNQSVLVR